MPDGGSPFQSDFLASLADIAPAGSPIRTEPGRSTLHRIGSECRSHLLEHVLPFWEPRVIDPDGPGLFHYFDRAGGMTDTSKSTWGQGRMAYTFSLLCMELRSVEDVRRERWLKAAESAERFLVDHAYAGEGRWHYRCTRGGAAMDKRGSAFSDAFALMGLAAHALATGGTRNERLIRHALDVFVNHVQDPSFDEYHHFKFNPAYQWHAPAMVAMGLAPLARGVLGDEAVRPLADWALERILWKFASDEHEMLLEMIDPQGRLVETEEGEAANPGHALESMWFCMEEALRRRDDESLRRCLAIVRWAAEKGYDHERGGLFAFITPDGRRPAGQHMRDWDDKIWWVQAESMYCLALAAAVSEDPFYLERLQQLHNWTMAHLPDRKYGEWFTSVDRDGRPKDTVKGNVFRSAFHVPRSLLKLARLADALEVLDASRLPDSMAAHEGRRCCH